MSDAKLVTELRLITERQVDQGYKVPLPEVAGDRKEIWYFLVVARQSPKILLLAV